MPLAWQSEVSIARRQESMRERHFQMIMKEINQTFDPKSEGFTLQKVLDLDLVQHSDMIARLADDAKKEAPLQLRAPATA